jgi:hypothetical protein
MKAVIQETKCYDRKVRKSNLYTVRSDRPVSAVCRKGRIARLGQNRCDI